MEVAVARRGWQRADLREPRYAGCRLLDSLSAASVRVTFKLPNAPPQARRGRSTSGIWMVSGVGTAGSWSCGYPLCGSHVTGACHGCIPDSVQRWNT